MPGAVRNVSARFNGTNGTWFPKPGVAGPIPAEGTSTSDDPCIVASSQAHDLGSRTITGDTARLPDSPKQLGARGLDARRRRAQFGPSQDDSAMQTARS